MKNNAVYKANFERADELFNNDASSICAKIVTERKLTDDESKVFLMVFYYIYTSEFERFKLKTKMSFLVLCYDDVS